MSPHIRFPRYAPALLVLPLTALTLSGCGGTGSAAAGDDKVVTVYSADGLKGERGDGWYDEQFEAFERKTGIKVRYVEGGSGEMVQRTDREKNNTQADVLVTLPPFIQQADSKGLLSGYEPEGAAHIPRGERPADAHFTPLVNNYFGFVHNAEKLPKPPETWDELLSEKYEGKVQYSTPGVAGDGTALLVKAIHDFGGRKRAMDYLGALQKNNVGPSSSTSKLAPKVDKGELLVANGDVQMNYAQAETMPNLGIWFPAAKKGAKPTTFALPYTAGLVKGGPHTENGRKLLDFLLGEKPQREVSSVGGGFTVRDDIEARDDQAEELAALMKGVEVFRPDWEEVAGDLDSYLSAWKRATGS
ncbi:2-aminoethylphosphonate ABC transporter substrate-binding protein [Streptomyces reniochalinae]|uniref:2-aminoethylphosphonate ABC transporter substrate-binding protein n=1 Tax=Streptomyces reniochalinae TaxID=2250578 RepID=A0A367E8W0_9ACTN|nr:2-aminoethylphosphonate ABC transporter substrate-binding protein [Streptomyces reniochalinae]RCG14496.1 2-aminoethylphosphonate ABC transporter substrate-binding protein [Streptomyces reniochalinae]